MKVQYCSDLHLEFPENNQYIHKHPIEPAGEILLLGGDILPLPLNHRDYVFFDSVADKFEAVYWIPGNHEYYGYDIEKAAPQVFKKIRNNVFLINNHTILHKDVRIICSTLWSHISSLNEKVIQNGLADFSSITINGNPLIPQDVNELHRSALSFIEHEVNGNATGKNIVITHHVPTLVNYPAKYKRSILQEGFASELSSLINQSNIDFWLYGHHHSNVPAFVVGNTTMLTNQLGYIRRNEYRKFRRDAVFEI